MQIWIDADGCPVVDITVQLAKQAGIRCTILCDTSHVFEKDGAQTLTVSKGADSVDFALENRVRPGDLVVTQDDGLAAMCLARRARPMHPNGWMYDSSNMEALLLQRHTAKKIRMAGGRLKGNAKRMPEQNAAFSAALQTWLRENAAWNRESEQEP